MTGIQKSRQGIQKSRNGVQEFLKGALPTLAFAVLFAVPRPCNAVDLAAECKHLTDHLAIDMRLHHDLKHDKVRVRCGKRTMEGGHAIRVVTLFRMPVHESSIRLDRYTGRLLTVSIDRLPIPRLAAPSGGWPSLGALEPAVRKQGQVPTGAKLVAVASIINDDDGLPAGAHPYGRFVFEHRVGGALVLGDRIVAQMDLRSRTLVDLDARHWTEVTPPNSRKTEGRALKVARRAMRKLDPALVPCCQDSASGEAAEAAIAKALGGGATRGKKRSSRAKRAAKRAARRKAKRRRKGRWKGPQIACEPRHRRRVYLHDRKGRLVEAYELACVPTCTRNGVAKRCREKQAAIAYVSTERGKLIGMKGDIAPARYRWQRPPPPRPKPLDEKMLGKRATELLTTAIKRVEPEVELKNPTCPPTEDDDTVVRRCWHLMLPALRYRARQTGSRIVWEAHE